MAAVVPVVIQPTFQLSRLTEEYNIKTPGLAAPEFSRKTSTMQSEKHICVWSSKSVVVLDVTTGKSKVLFNVKPEQQADFQIKSALMNPTHQMYALDFGGSLILMNSEGALKSYQLKQPVTFWKWVSPTTLGIVTDARVYHWSMHGPDEPYRTYERQLKFVPSALDAYKICDYNVDPDEKWFALTGLRLPFKRSTQVRGCTKLRSIQNGQFKVSDDYSQKLPSSAATFFKHDDVKLAGFIFTSTPEEGSKPTALPVITLQRSDLQALTFWSGGGTGGVTWRAQLRPGLEAEDDYPLAIHVIAKIGLVYVITHDGLLYVHDLETGEQICRTRLTRGDLVFQTTAAPTIGGIVAVTRSGAVLSVSMNQQTLVRWIAQTQSNPVLAINIAKRLGLPWKEALAENEPASPVQVQQARSAPPPPAQTQPTPDKVAVAVAVALPAYQVSASAVASSITPAAAPVSVIMKPSLHAVQEVPHAANKGPNGPALWQQAAEVASSRYSAYTALDDDSKSVMVKSVESVGNLVSSDQLSIISDVFQKFSGVAQTISHMAAPIVPGLFIVAVAFKALDKVVQQNANADMLSSRLATTSRSMVSWVDGVLAKATVDAAILGKLQTMLASLGAILTEVKCFLVEQPPAWAMKRLWTGSARLLHANALQQKLDDFLKQLQVAGFALTLDMHQQTVELQRQIHDCQESLSDQLQAIHAAIAGQSEQAAVNQSKLEQELAELKVLMKTMHGAVKESTVAKSEQLLHDPNLPRLEKERLLATVLHDLHELQEKQEAER